MLELLSTVIPLNIASTLSPGIFALSIVLLGGKWHSKSRTTALLLGTLIVGILAVFVGFGLGQAAPTGVKQNLASAIVDFLIGVFFIVFAIKALVVEEKKLKPSSVDTGRQSLKWLAVGVIVSATNFDALFLSFTAAKEVGGSSINDVFKIIFLIINLIFFTLPSSLPLFLYIAFPVFAGRILRKINKYVLKYSKYIIFVLFMIFGIIFVRRGIIFFF